MKSIYLDYAGTTRLDQRVLEKMVSYFIKNYGNPSSLHAPGRDAKFALETARASVAKILNAAPEEITFTGSGTESDNFAILGVARAYRQYGKHIIVSAIEHKAVLEASHVLEKEGFEVTRVGVDEFGIINLEEFRNALRRDTILVSIMYANNEIGTIQPIAEIAHIIKNFKSILSPNSYLLPLLHTDACQAAGFLPLDVSSLSVDLLTLNGGKIYGPKGVGCLYHRRGVKLEPLIVGGGQEVGLRGGTENVPLIVGFAKALELATKNAKKEGARLHILRDYFIKKLLTIIPETTLNGHPEQRLPNNINISIFGIEGEAMLLALDAKGIYASTGSACAARSLTPSHVLLALGLSPELAHGSLRFTLGKETTKEDLDYVLEVLPPIVADLRKISSINTRGALHIHETAIAKN